jgi:4-phytase / acid phosphatase
VHISLKTKTILRVTRQTALSIAFLFCAITCAPRVLAQSSPNGTQSRLKFALILSRHGVRSPTGSLDQLNQYSAQPWPKWEAAPGDLTSSGAKLMTLFGAYYRAYFAEKGLLSAEGCDDSVRVSIYADSDRRTAETGRSLAEGMFPSCAAAERPAQHFLKQGQADPLFHSLAAGVGKPNVELSVAAIAGRIGNDPKAVSDAYRPQLEILQRVLFGCPPASPCSPANYPGTKSLLDIPTSLDGGKGDHLGELRGPLSLAASVTENLLLEYTDGMPMEQVGWGRVDLATLKELMNLHTAAADINRRTPYLATVQASNLLAHILYTLQQQASGKPTPGALGTADDRVVLLIGHDTNLANIASMLNIDWLIDGRRDDTPPGGALVFELWQGADRADYEVRTYYTAQTLEQMRNLTLLTPKDPPARSDIFVPSCSGPGPAFPCKWEVFQRLLQSAIDPSFVK